jgi:uncharacterized protein (UPF0332 family)/predicted nucleotidyltransferase
MDFDIKKKNPLIKEQEANYIKEEIDIAYSFSKAMMHEFKNFLKSIVLFGSTARKTNDKGDIDVLIILDDVEIQFNKGIVQGYRVLTEEIARKISNKLHITSMRLTNFWEYVRAGDPLAVNILRDGYPILDTGLFTPLKLMLYQGKIKPSEESINNYAARSNYSITSAKNHILAACVDLYWAVIDSAEAALMKINEIPPSPAHVHNLIEEKFVNTGKIQKKYSIILHELYHLNKAIEHKEITNIPAEQYQKYLYEAEDFVETMHKIINTSL